MSLTTWMQSLWKVPPVGKLALNNLHKMKRPLKLNIWQDSCVHSAIFDYYMRRSILTLNLSKQQKVRIFLWICCSKTYRFFVFWFRFKVTFVLLVLWGEGGVLVAIVFCACWCLLSNYGCFLSPGALPIVHSSAHPAFGPPGFINPWSQCQPVFLIVDKADHCGTKYCLAPSLLQISKVPIIKGWYFCGRASRRCWSITPCDRYSPPVCPCQRWTAKWTIVPPSRSDHRVTGSHRGCLAHARDQKLSRKLFGDASLLEYTCCWHPDPEGGVVVGGKEGAVEEEAAVQVYLAERQPWDMHSARLQLRLPRPRKVASHVSITKKAFAFHKHDDGAWSKEGEREVTWRKGKSDKLLLDLCWASYNGWAQYNLHTVHAPA